MEEGLERKRKMNDKTGSRKIPKPDSPLPLNEIDENCLNENSEKWSIDDLVNIVENNNSLANAARDIFDKRFGTLQINVSNKFDVKTETILSSVKLLKHFGALIKKLKVVYLPTYCRYDKMLEDAIIANCSKTIVEMEIINATKFTLHEISEPFENVRTIHFRNGTICDIVSDVNGFLTSKVSN